MKAENTITLLVVLAAILVGYAGMRLGRSIYEQGQEAGLNVCEVRIERMVRDVDSLTVLVRYLESEVLGE